MEVRAEFGEFYNVEADALVVTIYEGEKAAEGALKELDERTGGMVSEMLGTDEMRGKQGDMVYMYRPGNIRAGRLLLVGAGKREEFSVDSVRKVAGAAARFLRSKGARTMAILRRSQLDLGKSAQAAVEGALIGLFEPDMYKTENKEERRIDELILVAAAPGSDDELAKGVERGRIIGEAVNFARERSLARPWTYLYRKRKGAVGAGDSHHRRANRGCRHGSGNPCAQAAEDGSDRPSWPHGDPGNLGFAYAHVVWCDGAARIQFVDAGSEHHRGQSRPAGGKD